MKDKRVGTTIYDTEGRAYKLSSMIAFGGEGKVYEEESGKFVIKIIYNKNHIEKNGLRKKFSWLKNQKVDDTARLVKPIAILEEPLLGYVMVKIKEHTSLLKKYIKPGGKSIGEWFNGDTGGLKRRLYFGYKIAKMFSALHLEGLSFCDISPKNILVGSRYSTFLIDADNLSISSQPDAYVMGTPRYIAPEVLKKVHKPNALSDVYSYAVILFEMLCLGHPLIGDRVMNADPIEEEKALKGEYPYIDHKQEDTNRNTNILPREVMFTERLAKLFERVFVDGLEHRNKRPSMKEFEYACMEAAEKLVVCQSCKGSFYGDFNLERKMKCPWCSTEQPMAPYIEFMQIISTPEDIKMSTPNKIVAQKVIYEKLQRIKSTHFSITEIAREIGQIRYDAENEIGIYFKNISNKRLRIYRANKNLWEWIEPDEDTMIQWNKDLFMYKSHKVSSEYTGAKLFLCAKFMRGV